MSQTTMKPALRQLKGRHGLIGAEIGVYDGINALHYFKELNIESVFLIDPYAEYENYYPEKIGLKKLKEMEAIAHLRLSSFRRKIKWIKEKSVVAAEYIADESLDFVYIDGNHSYDSVVEDILLYYHKIKKGGMLSGHDYDYESVKKAVNEFTEGYGLRLYTENEAAGKKKYDWWFWKKDNLDYCVKLRD